MHADVLFLKKGRVRADILCLLAFLACFSVQSALAAGEPVGKVELVTGAVQVARAGKTETVKAGASVFLQDKWQTKENSSVEIVFVDGSRVKMTSNTVLEITEYLYKPAEKTRQSLLSMVSGKANFVVQDLQDFKEKRFRVQTQTAVVGTRDTRFGVWVVDALLTKALCIENVIVMWNRSMVGAPILLTANMISEVYGEKPPTPPRFATPAEHSEFLKDMEDVGGKGAGTTRGKGISGDAGKREGGTTMDSTGVTSVTSPTTTAMPTTTTVASTTSTTSTSSSSTSTSTTTTTTTTTTTSTTRPTLPRPPQPPGTGAAGAGRK